MTVLEDRIAMADADAATQRLDDWSERLGRMPVPEGSRVEIVGGNADPYQGRCLVFTDPRDGDYAEPRKVDFGTDIDLTGTVADLVLKTDAFPRD
ncbi:hypothetical protein ACN6LA_005944 [Streptomyces sp. SAS_269]|uniref:hypothetical protein n=1 Tax=Streptomyces sp. SAS_269 TaxID=3412749 RepID=UPI00403C3C6A